MERDERACWENHLKTGIKAERDRTCEGKGNSRPCQKKAWRQKRKEAAGSKVAALDQDQRAGKDVTFARHSDSCIFNGLRGEIWIGFEDIQCQN